LSLAACEHTNESSLPPPRFDPPPQVETVGTESSSTTPVEPAPAKPAVTKALTKTLQPAQEEPLVERRFQTRAGPKWIHKPVTRGGVRWEDDADKVRVKRVAEPKTETK
jgi:hypothetical protein